MSAEGNGTTRLPNTHIRKISIVVKDCNQMKFAFDCLIRYDCHWDDSDGQSIGFLLFLLLGVML